ncbi:hypothetical protein INT47_007176 [Mucor saturninus]|uniref:Uncharacterized protein n=1 Tax=Mucor saturninus TaxID=64648 RepID=A0A8H7R6K5_9FUNG|nr:hypothetical protein INT47_007176 [Mucor saturninus]
MKMIQEYIELKVNLTEKSVIEVGLSSILDLTHPEDNYQGYLFSKELKDLNGYFYRQFKLEKTPNIPSLGAIHFE